MGQKQRVLITKMSADDSDRHASTAHDGILGERSPTLPELVNGQATTTLSSSSCRHVHFNGDEFVRGADGTPLLALAHMPPESDNKDEPVQGQAECQTATEEELEHDVNELADHDGDSDDDSHESESILGHVGIQREADSAEVSHDGFTVSDTNNNEDAVTLLPGAPVGWKPPGPPADWKPANPKKNFGQPDVKFNKIDNPGRWSAFTY